MGEVVGTEIKSPEPTADAPQQDATGVTTPAPEQRPEWLLEKFKTPEDMAKAYGELERKQSQAPHDAAVKDAGDGTPNPKDDPPQGGDTGGDPEQKPEDKGDLNIQKQVYYGEAVDTAMESAGLNPSDVAKEWDENQSLSQDTFDKLEKAGYPRSIVDSYIQGFVNKQAEVTALQEQQVADIKALAGGEEGYARLHDWAAASLPREELESYNEIVDGGNSAMIQLAVRGLQSKFEQAEGRDPNLVTGGNTPGGGDVFESHQQVALAMKAAKESGDPAEIKKVEQKALRSPAL